jgi:hypothetical protein
MPLEHKSKLSPHQKFLNFAREVEADEDERRFKETLGIEI